MENFYATIAYFIFTIHNGGITFMPNVTINKIKSNFVFTVNINLWLKPVSHALYETFK